VTPRDDPKSFSRESAFASPVTDADAKREQIQALAEGVAERARRKDALYRTIGVKAVEPPYDVNTRERSLPGPVDDPDLVVEHALDLFAEFEDDAIRKVGVRVANLSFTDRDQPSLDSFSGRTEESADADAGDETGMADADAGDETGMADADAGDEASLEDDDAGDAVEGETATARTGHKTHTGGSGQSSLTDF
jgi:DNA polymerase IV (DinB-like DNA polymerase)